jgi:hypothetical protein
MAGRATKKRSRRNAANYRKRTRSEPLARKAKGNRSKAWRKIGYIL